MCYLRLRCGNVVVFDEQDKDLIESATWYYRHTARNKFYVVSRLGRLHRLIMNPRKGETVDHVNSDTLDNRRSNLRICTQAENLLNKQKTKQITTSPYIGVHKCGSKWRAQIKYKEFRTQIGMFDSAEEAASARDLAAIFIHGEFASLNFEESRVLLFA